MRYLITSTFVLFLALASAPSGLATTIIPLEFGVMVRQSGVIVKGTVTDLKAVWTGVDVGQSTPKTHVAPQKPSSVAVDEDAEEVSGAGVQGQAGLSAPESVGIEGGRMLLTEVTLTVERTIVGEVDATVTFRMAGGTDGQTRVIVHGMPEFELGKRYLVFFRQDFDVTAAPIIGFNQGYFEVSRDVETGEEILLNAYGDLVIGVENDQVILRHSPKQGMGSISQLAPAPVPEGGSHVRSDNRGEFGPWGFRD